MMIDIEIEKKIEKAYEEYAKKFIEAGAIPLTYEKWLEVQITLGKLFGTID